MRQKICGVLLALMVLLATVSLWAHHSPSAIFEMSKRITMAGTLTKIDWINPHIVVYIDGKAETGKAESWVFESNPPAWFRRVGVGRADFAKSIGQEVKVEGVAAVAARRNQNALVGAFVHHRAVKVAHRRNADRVPIALGLDHDLAAQDGARVVGDDVDAAVARGAGQLRFEPHPRKEVPYQVLELVGVQVHQVGPAVELAQQVTLLHKALVDHVELDDRLPLDLGGSLR